MTKPLENPRKALGKGLAAFLPSRVTATEAQKQPTPSRGAPTTLPIDRIDPNPVQPRTVFEADRLRELAESIKNAGVIQPLIVRQKADRFELVAGERRWRAARMAGLSEVPVVIQSVDDDHVLELSLIENIQREDLNPIEVAHAFDRLHREHGLTHEEIAQRTGKDRTSVTNMLRLLKLPPDIQLLVAEHRLSMGHARALLGLSDPDLQRLVSEKACSQGLSVRQVERIVKKMTQEREAKPPEESRQDPNIRAAVQELERVLGTRVRIVERSEQRGKIEIEYYSQEELDRIFTLITEGRQP